MEKQSLVAPELAKGDDLDQVVRLIRDISRWLKTKGVSQWSDAFPCEVLEQEASRDELYVLRDEGFIIGTVALSSDPGDLWEDSPAEAIYLHRLAIVRDRAGQRLGEAMMNWAEAEVRRKGAKYLRLVCDASNPFLSEYYKSLGYLPRGTKLYEPWSMTFARFEKRVR